MSYIMLVEDNMDNAKMIIRLLETNGYQVQHFAEGMGCLTAARKARPDLVLMDFNLPDIDGRTLVLSLKKQLGAVSTPPPIIAVTARTGLLEEKLAERFGCDAFVNKPFDPKEFIDLVDHFMGISLSKNG